MADLIRSDDELGDAVLDVACNDTMRPMQAAALGRMTATIRAAWAERDRMKAVYVAAVKWRKIDRRGLVPFPEIKALRDAVDAAEGKK